MKHLRMIPALLMLLMLLAPAAALAAPFEEPRESRIVYDNQVVKTIDAQLKDISLQQVREKESLILDRSIGEIQAAVQKGALSYTELTAFYLDRIKRFDKAENGINAVMEVNPHAIAIARQLDEGRAQAASPLYGIPILLKDNINTRDMPTSAGTYALKDFYPSEDAPVVQALKGNHAIILGKANLSELANYMDFFMPSGYSAKLGQTHNPFDPLVLTPSGSSSGSAAAVAANLCAASLGTETTGSIISPAQMQSLVGFKPTKGLISAEGVVPLSSTMDTVGPLAKTVADAALLFNASVGDPARQVHITSEGLKNKRIGVLQEEGSEQLADTLQKLGATVTLLHENLERFDSSEIIRQEFAADFADYARRHGAPVKTLGELAAFNNKDIQRRARYGQELMADAALVSRPDRDKINQMVSQAKGHIDALMADHQLDAIAFVGEGALTLPCMAGYPEITVPFGQYATGEPFGITFFARAHEDEKLINIAQAFEQGTLKRLIPEKYQSVDKP